MDRDTDMDMDCVHVRVHVCLYVHVNMCVCHGHGHGHSSPCPCVAIIQKRRTLHYYQFLTFLGHTYNVHIQKLLGSRVASKHLLGNL